MADGDVSASGRSGGRGVVLDVMMACCLFGCVVVVMYGGSAALCGVPLCADGVRYAVNLRSICPDAGISRLLA
ncbi:hypothetical protein THI4931_01740 [Pandoraea sputorum]|nr:hypothetical protein THI4931_01740 [Pandoraea sputorum]